jgi:hypothetical protein
MQLSFPDLFLQNLFGPDLIFADVEVQSLAYSPDSENSSVISSLFGISISNSISANNISLFQNLFMPVLITVPVSSSLQIVQSQVDCVLWNEFGFSTDGCSVSSIQNSLSSDFLSVTCSCNSLGLLAISMRHDYQSPSITTVTVTQVDDQGGGDGNQSHSSSGSVKGNFKFWPFDWFDSGSGQGSGPGQSVGHLDQDADKISPIIAYLATIMAFLALLIIFSVVQIIRLCSKRQRSMYLRKKEHDDVISTDMVYLGPAK